MQSVSGMFGFIHLLASWFMRLAVTNLLWFIINIPVGIVVLTYLVSDREAGVHLLPLIILLPLLFFPSTTALFAMARDWMRDEDHSSLVRSYFSLLKENYKITVRAGIIWVIIWGIWMLDFRFFSGQNELLASILLIIGILLSVVNIHFFSLTVHYRMTVRELLQNSFFMTVGRPLLTISTALVVFLVGYASTTLWFLLVFFTGSLIACISFYLFYRSYLKIRKKALNKAQG